MGRLQNRTEGHDVMELHLLHNSSPSLKATTHHTWRDSCNLDTEEKKIDPLIKRWNLTHAGGEEEKKSLVTASPPAPRRFALWLTRRVPHSAHIVGGANVPVNNGRHLLITAVAVARASGAAPRYLAVVDLLITLLSAPLNKMKKKNVDAVAGGGYGVGNLIVRAKGSKMFPLHFVFFTSA